MTLTPDYYHDSSPFNLLRTSMDERYLSAVDVLMPLLKLKDTRLARECLLMVLVNVVRLASYRPTHFLYYSRDNNDWTDLNRREALPFNPFRISRKLVEVVGAMADAGYLHHVIGHNPKPGEVRWAVQSRMGLTPQLLAFIKVHRLRDVPTLHASSYPVIRMRDGDGGMVYGAKRMPKAVARSDVFLRRYNAFMAEQDIQLDAVDHGVFLDEVSVYRVFNRNDWQCGGRLAGAWWMNCGRELRKAIYVNGEPTVELDYAAQHINLLYGLRGLALPSSDPYALHGFKREVVKAVCLRLINASDVEQAWQACRSEALKDVKAQRASVLAAEIDGCLSSLTDFEDGIVQAIRAKHSAIADDLCCDKGIGLMNLDSFICLSVLERLTSHGIPCLSVHDSFLVAESHEADLRLAMVDAYGAVGLKDFVPCI
ncbi:MAG: hypothetical protein DI628_07720 [Blastochloris viridis]|uniref:DNA-directed RNA polymerase n=1 Tax=Blastochloris viridis TaxID=1079 RepID=A0A6N4RBZ4_BLAVI|nr:MAG: hypothetical protein DI628_07720 [Blastochloris viridis]